MILNIEIQEQINNLVKTKNRIETNISTFDRKKEQLRSAISVISPSTENEIKITELNIEKTKINLRKELKRIEFEIRLKTGIITQEEYNKNISELDKQTQSEINQIDENIQVLTVRNQPGKYDKLKKSSESTKKSLTLDSESSKRQIAQSRKDQLKGIIIPGAREAIVLALSVIINRFFLKLSEEVANLEILVDKTNDIITNVRTKEDVAKARIARNNAVRVLNSASSRISAIQKIIKTIHIIITIINIILLALKILVKFVPPLIKNTLEIILLKLEPIFVKLFIISSIYLKIINDLANQVEELKRRLKQIEDIIDNVLSDPNYNFNNSDLLSLTPNNYGKLGILNGIIYKGFKFAIKEENNPNFVVQGFKRRYAVALNRDGNEVLQSEASFTLDPEVLVEELRLIIDERELTP